MPTTSTLVAFVAVSAVFAALPGPSNLFIVAQSIRCGRSFGAASAVGCCLGAWCYVVLTATGLSAVIAASARALSVLHFVGGAYLLVLALRAFRTAGTRVDVDSAVSRKGSVGRGALVELTNPKVALFFLAFFPQFVRAHRGPAWAQIVVLGSIFCAVGLVSDTTYALTVGSLRARLRGHRRLLARGESTSGVLYAGLAGWAFWSGARDLR